MLAIALGIGAVLALLGAGWLVLGAGAGWVVATIAGSVAAVASFVFTRHLLTRLRSRTLRWSVGLLLILPTAALAYSIGLDALATNVPTEMWRQALATGFAAAMSAIAFTRLAGLDSAEE